LETKRNQRARSIEERWSVRHEKAQQIWWELLKSSDKQSLTKQIFQFCSILNIVDIDTFITIIAVDIKQGHFLIVNSILLLGHFVFTFKMEL
jgi:hypothetical protein